MVLRILEFLSILKWYLIFFLGGGPNLLNYFFLGPLHMSPVTGLARLSGRILWCVHMGNFSPVDRDEFKNTQPKW